MGYLNNNISGGGGGGGNASWDVTDISASVASVSQVISGGDSRTLIKCTDWVKSSGATINLECKLAGVAQTLDTASSTNTAFATLTNDLTQVSVANGGTGSTAVSFELEVIKGTSGFQVFTRSGRNVNDQTGTELVYLTTQTDIDEIVLTPSSGTIDGGKLHVQTLGE